MPSFPRTTYNTLSLFCHFFVLLEQIFEAFFVSREWLGAIAPLHRAVQHLVSRAQIQRHGFGIVHLCQCHLRVCGSHHYYRIGKRRESLLLLGSDFRERECVVTQCRRVAYSRFQCTSDSTHPYIVHLRCEQPEQPQLGIPNRRLLCLHQQIR